MPPNDEPVFIPAPGLPPGPRNALIIATGRYDDLQLRQLRSPVRDAEEFAAVLADPEIGGFTVTQLVDQTEVRVRRQVAGFLRARTADETVLVYLSCHGIQDRRGRLLFAATDTESQLPHASAVRAADLLDELDECRAHRQILILDCCFSGSFGDKADGELNLGQKLRGHSRGREVLTASRSFEYSYEGKPVDGKITGSVFTTGLVQGLRGGAADRDRSGLITVEEAYDYAFGCVQRGGAAQTPQRWLSRGEGRQIVLARSVAGRAVTPAPLPEHLLLGLQSGPPHVRIGAVNGIAEWITDLDPARKLAAVRALESVADDDIRRVAEVARAHLADGQRPGAGSAAVSAPAAQRSQPGSGSTGAASWIPRTAATVLDAGTGPLTSVAFSPDGRLLASAGEAGTVELRDVSSDERVNVLEGHAGPVYDLAFNPVEPQLVTAGHDGTVRFWT